MADFDIEIITPERIIFSDKITSVTIPGTSGSFQILYNHAPLISTFEIGLIKIVKPDTSTLYFATSGGTVEVNKNKVLVLADSFESAESIDVERAKSAKQRAEERLAHKTETIDVERAQVALRRAVNRLNIVEKYVRGLV